MSRVVRSRARGSKLPPGAIYVGRPTIWGNPFDSAAAFREWLVTGRVGVLPMRKRGGVTTYRFATADDWHSLAIRRVIILERLPELAGKTLACWCSLETDCHADILEELANNGTKEYRA